MLEKLLYTVTLLLAVVVMTGCDETPTTPVMVEFQAPVGEDESLTCFEKTNLAPRINTWASSTQFFSAEIMNPGDSILLYTVSGKPWRIPGVNIKFDIVFFFVTFVTHKNDEASVEVLAFEHSCDVDTYSHTFTIPAGGPTTDIDFGALALRLSLFTEARPKPSVSVQVDYRR